MIIKLNINKARNIRAAITLIDIIYNTADTNQHRLKSFKTKTFNSSLNIKGGLFSTIKKEYNV